MRTVATRAGIVALAVVLLPALALALLVSRPLALLFLCGGLVLLAVSQRARRWLLGGESPVSARGVRLADDVMLAPTHTWVRRRGWRGARVGADDLMARTLGPLDEVRLPQPGARIERGETLFTLRSGTRDVSVRSPLSGTVARINPCVGVRPPLINLDPYGDGWAVELDAPAFGAQRRHLLDRTAARAFLAAQVERLLQLTSPVAARAYAQDGGVIVDTLHQQLDGQTWERVRHSFFGA